MFFRKDYARPGPGIDPNEPEKTGFARFFQIIGLECVTLLKLNLLFLLCCIPVLTIPPALFAMHQVVRKMVLDQPVDCFYHYRTAFRRRLGRSYIAFLLTAAPLAASGYGAFFYLRYAAENYVAFLPFMVCSTIFLVTMLASPYLYGVLGAGRPVWTGLRLALALGLGKPLRAIAADLCSYGLTLAALMPFPITVPYFIFLGFSLPCLLANFYIRSVLRQYCPEESETKQKQGSD